MPSHSTCRSVNLARTQSDNLESPRLARAAPARSPRRGIHQHRSTHSRRHRGSADGKSILSVLLLAASRGTCLIIKTDGDDEERALNALVELVEQKFGEELSDGVF